MNKIKIGMKVLHIKNKTIHTVVAKIKGAKTNQPVYHSGLLFNGYKSKPTRFLLDTGEIVLPKELST